MNFANAALAAFAVLIVLLLLLRWLSFDAKLIDSEKRKEMRRIEIEYGQLDSDPNRRRD